MATEGRREQIHQVDVEVTEMLGGGLAMCWGAARQL